MCVCVTDVRVNMCYLGGVRESRLLVHANRACIGKHKWMCVPFVKDGCLLILMSELAERYKNIHEINSR